MADDVVAAIRSMEQAVANLSTQLLASSRDAQNPSYKEALGKKTNHNIKLQPGKSNPVQDNIYELRRRSSSSSPVCFKCGDLGHLVGACKNATLFFC
jgi:hypothetical protein